ncbi:hypothetical protein LEM8419_02860 [Neolewinella maritima]|uniref:Amidohydrolase 3 domain-containing protein n=1 Tax=Neolewinella maritima TaxID=1383882 RepID=A0ABM9B3N3_9BACT|nr:hypothetical protein LEM8419_02860 [Neolewinella maritima]
MIVSLRCLLVFLLFCLSACTSNDDPAGNDSASLLVYNAAIWSGKDLPPATALLVAADGTIERVGMDADTSDWSASLTTATQRVDADGAFLMPGFIEGHAHFSGLGSSLRNLNFLRSRSWEEIVAIVAERAEDTPKGDWITGRG